MAGKFIRIGLIRCPLNHTALGHPFYNRIDLRDDEKTGTEIDIECGLCFKRFKGKVEKLSERYMES